MFALEVNPATRDPIVVLNPGAFIIPKKSKKLSCWAYVMAEDKDEADLVTNMVLEKRGDLRRKSVFERGLEMLKQLANPERAAKETEFQQKITRRKTEIANERKKSGKEITKVSSEGKARD